MDDRAFTASELIEHAIVNEHLRQALWLAQITTAKQLGRILARVEKRPVPG